MHPDQAMLRTGAWMSGRTVSHRQPRPRQTGNATAIVRPCALAMVVSAAIGALCLATLVGGMIWGLLR